MSKEEKQKHPLHKVGDNVLAINKRSKDLFMDTGGENSRAVSDAIYNADHKKFEEFMVEVGVESKSALESLRIKFESINKADVIDNIKVGDGSELRFQKVDKYSDKRVSQILKLAEAHNNLSKEFEKAMSSGTMQNWSATKVTLEIAKKILSNAS